MAHDWHTGVLYSINVCSARRSPPRTAFPAIDDIKRTWSELLLTLSQAGIAKALAASGETLDSNKQQQLVESLEIAFCDYFRERLWQLWAAKTPAGRGARELDKIARAADKLVKLLGLSDGFDQMPEFWRSILEREAEFYGEKIGGFPGLLLDNPAALVDNEGVATRKFGIKGKTKLRECLDGLLLLQTLLHAGVTYERKKVTPKSSRNRRDADEAMPKLFDELNRIWIDAFGKKPATTWNAYASDAGGPYVRFLLPLFRALRDAFTAAVRKEYPKLASGLPTTPQAIRARVRASLLVR